MDGMGHPDYQKIDRKAAEKRVMDMYNDDLFILGEAVCFPTEMVT